QQMDGAAEWRRPNRRCRAGTAVEVHSADPLRRKKRPGVMRGRVGVIKRNAVEVDVVIAVHESAEVSLALPQSNTVGAGAEGSGYDLHQLAKIGNGRGEILNIVF